MSDGYKTIHLVDADLRPLIQQYAAADRSLPLLERRAQFRASWQNFPPDLACTRTERFIPGPAGAPDVRVLVYDPVQAKGARPALLHIHGGGYIIGAPEMDDVRNATLAVELGCVIVSVDYRLAPEAPYPGALEDCYAALLWLSAHAEELKVDPSWIGVTGASAGGGHAAALALLARDRAQVTLAYQWLIYPMIDDRTGDHPNAGEFIWTAEANRAGWAALFGCEPGGKAPGPYAAAARVEDLAGLPTTLIQTVALDLFAEENMEYARRLMRAGVATELHVYPGGIHGCTMLPSSRSARAIMKDGVAALKLALEPMRN